MSVIVKPKKSASCFGDDMFVVPGQLGRTVKYEAGRCVLQRRLSK